MMNLPLLRDFLFRNDRDTKYERNFNNNNLYFSSISVQKIITST